MGDTKKAGTLYGGIDIGGTKLYVVITDETGKILGTAKKKTKAERGFDSVMERVVTVVESACEDSGTSMKEIAVFGVGAPSPILPDGTAINAPNMGWSNVPLVGKLRKALGRPVYAENDCNAGTLGEYALGGGTGSKSLVGLFMGTGLGGGVIQQGQLMTGENCMAAELGHTIVVVDGRKCGCGHNGCLEAYASKTGMGWRFAHEILYQGRDSMIQEEYGADFSNVKSSILAKAYEKGDAVVVETLHEAARYLGIGVANFITTFGPDRVVLGGGVLEALGKQLLPRIRETAKAYTHPPASFKDTKIALAKLGDDAVALGAMVYGKQRLAAEGTPA